MIYHGFKWIEENKDLIIEANDIIWQYSEISLEEYKTSAYLANILTENGFKVEKPVAGIDTAFVAKFGVGKPEIGVLAEYDALPGLSQKVKTYKEPITKGGPGHGCGHNSIAAGVLGGVIGLKEEMIKKNIPGTIVFYGCPAEEGPFAKQNMASAGVFNNSDVILTWHSGDINCVVSYSTNSFLGLKFKFHGKSSHAAIAPYDGRSALDAVELMNVGANYLREHMISDAKIHYIITKGGDAVSIIPEFAEVQYAIRSPKKHQVTELYERLLNIAKGAALMTETTFDVELISACREILPNTALEEVLLEAMLEIGAPAWDEEDRQFAKGMMKNISDRSIDIISQKYGIRRENFEIGLHDFVYNGFPERGLVMAGSSDVGDVSQIAPLAQFRYATSVMGTQAHTWVKTACSGSSLAHKGVLAAAKTFALTGYKLLINPSILEKAKKEFNLKTEGKRYESAIPEDLR